MTYDVYQVFPILSVRVLEEAIAYYTQRLGFEHVWSWGTPTFRAGVRLGKVEFQLVCDPTSLPSGPSVAHCHMHEVDGYYAACREKGAEIVMDLGDRPYGARTFSVVDPSGNRIGFAEVLARSGA